MKLLAIKGFSGIDISIQAGQIFEVDDAFGKDLIAIGYAEKTDTVDAEPKKAKKGKATDED